MPYTKDFHFSPLGQRGGLSTYPVAGVVSGAKLTLNGTVPGIDDTDSTLASFTITAGTVRFDGYPITFNNYNVTVPAGGDLATASITLKLYMNPVRKVPLVTTLPSAASYAEGAFVAKATLVDGGAYDMYQVVEQLYVKDSGAWRIIEPFNGNDYPRAYGWNNMPYNEIVTTSQPLISATPELPAFLNSKLPPHTARPLAMFRQSAFIYLGEVTYSGGAATITESMPEYHLLPI